MSGGEEQEAEEEEEQEEKEAEKEEVPAQEACALRMSRASQGKTAETVKLSWSHCRRGVSWRHGVHLRTMARTSWLRLALLLALVAEVVGWPGISVLRLPPSLPNTACTSSVDIPCLQDLVVAAP